MILRAYRKEDSAVICKWLATEEDLYKWSADRFNKFPLLEDDINENYAPQIKSRRFIPLTATDEKENIIGHFIIRYPRENDNSTVRFGFVIINPLMRGRGYGKEMLTLGLKYAFEFLQADKVTIGVYENNDIAHNCYKALGFRDISITEKEPFNVIEMEILRQENN